MQRTFTSRLRYAIITVEILLAAIILLSTAEASIMFSIAIKSSQML
jgi:hypothetical protein